MSLLNHMQAVALCWLRTDKETIYKKCFGYADIAKKIPVSMETPVSCRFSYQTIYCCGNFKTLLDKTINAKTTWRNLKTASKQN